MSGAKSANKLRRLVLAQTVAESLAKSHVGQLSAQLSEMETKLDTARDSFARSETSLLFSDLHLQHINGLIRQSEEKRTELESARRELQSETVRNKKLRQRLRVSLSEQERDAENKMLLERLDRQSGRG